MALSLIPSKTEPYFDFGIFISGWKINAIVSIASIIRGDARLIKSVSIG
jgi:hypothetical protein